MTVLDDGVWLMAWQPGSRLSPGWRV